MGYVSAARAVTVRLLFAAHGVVSIWRLADVTDNATYWYLSGTLILLLLESMLILIRREGKEWKWFCPSVFIYILTSVPAIWFLELHEFDKRAKHHARLVRIARMNNHTLISTESPEEVQEDLNASIGSFLGVKFTIRIPIKLTPDQWIRMLEQMLLLILILGRWLLPKGKLTHDQLSQLLLVYIGTAADIVEFFEAFKEKEVRYQKPLCMAILGIWSLSLIQFSLVLTASKARRDQSGLYNFRISTIDDNSACGCRADVFGILVSILLQDLPFLVLRLLLIFKYNVVSYTNMFFTAKNSLVIILLMYRLIVVFVTRNTHIDDDFVYESPKVHIIDDDAIPFPEMFLTNPEAETKKKLLPSYPVEFRTKCHNGVHKVFEVKPEKHKWGKAYHFERVHNPLTPN